MNIETKSLVLAVAILLPGVVLAQGRIGVTSQTEGDPLGDHDWHMHGRR